MAFTVLLDPTAVATNRTQLDLQSAGLTVGPGAIDWGDAQIQAYMANQTWGETPVSYRVPNRQIRIPLLIGGDGTGATFDTANHNLKQKVALLQREGGWLQRGSGSSVLYADVVNATLTFPDQYGETGHVQDQVVLVLECLPDFYGDEVTLDSASATGVLFSKLKLSGSDAVIAGDHPGRCRIIVTDTSGNDQLALPWGLRSRHYDGAATAKLFYEAEALTPLDAAATFVHSGASGGSTMRHNSLPGGSWCPVLLTDILSGTAAWTHTGSYRIWARCYSATATPQLRLAWGVGDVAHPVTNDAVQVPAAAGFYLLDLGEVRLDPPPVGSMKWQGVVQAFAAVQGDPVEIDCIYLQPLDEPAGRLVAVQTPSVFGIHIVESAGAGADDSGTGTVAWSNPGSITTADGNSATVPVDSIFHPTSHYLDATGFGFNIPSGATISGIVIELLRSSAVVPAVRDNRVRLIKAGTIQATDKADTSTPWPTTAAYKSYGGSTDLWGGTWAAADINASNFGVAISAQSLSSSSGTAQIDHVRITVYYTDSGGFATAQDAVVHASHIAELRTEQMIRQDSTGSVYGPVAEVVGDLPRIPPSGIESRAVELFVKPTRSDLTAVPDSALDSFTAQVKYRPCYLFRN